ncbi:MAG: phosphoribosylanthranilate isomerase [Oscillospiraceae bacterium]|nr:phosphoribosylanthranilate isomerase [Oscillospiraceae bacterium]
MTKIKLCGLSRPCDLEVANRLQPEYVGFVFAPKSRRYVTDERAAELKNLLAPGIRAVGVFVNEAPERVAGLLNGGLIHMAQLHGRENEDYIRQLRALTDKPLIQAFRVETETDLTNAEGSTADHILLDSGAGTGKAFDWKLIRNLQRPYFLAGGLSPDNVGQAIRTLHPFAVDVSSGIETDGAKDQEKMAAFVAAVRERNTVYE